MRPEWDSTIHRTPNKLLPFEEKRWGVLEISRKKRKVLKKEKMEPPTKNHL